MLCHDPLPIPRVVDAGTGKLVLLDEFVRLEGHHWASSWTKGRGSIYRLDRYGYRGESLLLPSFCRVEEPDLGVHLETEHGRQDTSWLCPGLAKLAADVEPRKLSLSELLQTIQSSSSIEIVLPVAKLGFDSAIAVEGFSRGASRRCPFYIKAFDMGARLQLSMVPSLKTRTGDPDSVDAEILAERLSAQLLPVHGQRARLCIRRLGGPVLDARGLQAGASLQDICRYLTSEWVRDLVAAPSSWARLDAYAERSCYLEAALGPVPGLGSFVPWKSQENCDVCGSAAVGSQVPEKEGTALAVCRDCAAFVPGSQAFAAKQALAQHTSRPEHQLVGSFDSGLDDALGSGGDQTEDPAFSGNYMWPEGTVGKKDVVLVAGGMLSLRPPKKGWPVNLDAELHKQLRLVLGCEARCLKILGTAAEAESPNIIVNFVFLHPVMFFAGKDHDVNEVEGADKDVDPVMPLTWYEKLQKELRNMAEAQHERKTWTKGEQDVAAPLLLVSDLKRVVLPCSLLLLKSHQEFCIPAAFERSPSQEVLLMHGDVNALLDQVRDREPQAKAHTTAAASAARRRHSERERRSTVAELSQEDLATARRRMTEVSRPGEEETIGNLELPQRSKESQDAQSAPRKSTSESLPKPAEPELSAESAESAESRGGGRDGTGRALKQKLRL